MHVQFEAVSEPEFMSFWDDIDDSFQMPTHLSDGKYHVLRQRYWPSNLPLSLSCEVVENRSALASPTFFSGTGPDVCAL